MGGGIGSATNKVRNIVTIDSYYGLMALGSSGGKVEVEDSIFYGGKDMQNLDCPDKSSCSACESRRGLMIPTFGKHNTIMNLAPKHIPKMHADGGSWGGSSLFSNLKFIGWDSDLNHCGAKQRAIATNFQHSDYHPLANFRFITFEDSDESALYGFDSPSPGWANLSDCGTFTCTGLYNVLIEMY